jgi:hypothetical protein
VAGHLLAVLRCRMVGVDKFADRKVLDGAQSARRVGPDPAGSVRSAGIH